MRERKKGRKGWKEDGGIREKARYFISEIIPDVRIVFSMEERRGKRPEGERERDASKGDG